MQLGDLIVALLAVFAYVAFVLVMLANRQAYDDGYDDGYDRGYQDALDDMRARQEGLRGSTRGIISRIA